MCTVQIKSVVFVVQLSLFCGPLALADDETKELVGEWRVVALQSEGKQDSGVSFHGMIWKLDQSEYVLTPGVRTPAGLAGKRSVTVRYSVDNDQLPKHFTQILGDRKLLGIYRIKDGRLNVCLARFGNDRPTSFETKGTDNLCYVLERTNSEADKDVQIPVERRE